MQQRRICGVFIILVALGVSFDATTGNADEMGYDKLSQNNFAYLTEHKNLLLVSKGSEPASGLDSELDTRLTERIGEFGQAVTDLTVNIVRDGNFAAEKKRSSLPRLFLFRSGRHLELTRDDLMADDDTFSEWVSTNAERVSHELTDATFEHDTQASTGATTGDWFVLFHRESNRQETLRFESAWEFASLRLRNRVLFAYVDIDANVGLKERFKITDTPTFIFFRQGRMYSYEIGKHDTESLVQFATTFFKNIKANKVPREKIWFDSTIETIVSKMKEQNATLVYAAFGAFALLVIAILLTLANRSKKAKSS